MVISYTDITIFVMDNKSFERYKRILIFMIAAVFIIQKSWTYFEEKKETNEIVFYTLPAQTEHIESRSIDMNENIENEDIEREETAPEIEEKTDKININTASSEELQKLYRIGPAIASRIIEYRQSYGNFETIEELMEVKGIGEKIFEANKDKICVK